MIDNLKVVESFIQNKSLLEDRPPELTKENGTLCRNQIFVCELSYKGKRKRLQNATMIYRELLNE